MLGRVRTFKNILFCAECISGVTKQHRELSVQPAKMPHTELENSCPFIPVQLQYFPRITHNHAPVLQGHRVPGSLGAFCFLGVNFLPWVQILAKRLVKEYSGRNLSWCGSIGMNGSSWRASTGHWAPLSFGAEAKKQQQKLKLRGTLK